MREIYDNGKYTAQESQIWCNGYNQALQDIKQEILGKLPKEWQSREATSEEPYANGFNQCLAQVKKIIGEL